MMIKLMQGDILKSDAEALANPVNCVGVMGRSFALQFRSYFPDERKTYTNLSELPTLPHSGAESTDRVFCPSNPLVSVGLLLHQLKLIKSLLATVAQNPVKLGFFDPLLTLINVSQLPLPTACNLFIWRLLIDSIRAAYNQDLN